MAQLGGHTAAAGLTTTASDGGVSSIHSLEIEGSSEARGTPRQKHLVMVGVFVVFVVAAGFLGFALWRFVGSEDRDEKNAANKEKFAAQERLRLTYRRDGFDAADKDYYWDELFSQDCALCFAPPTPSPQRLCAQNLMVNGVCPPGACFVQGGFKCFHLQADCDTHRSDPVILQGGCEGMAEGLFKSTIVELNKIFQADDGSWRDQIELLKYYSRGLRTIEHLKHARLLEEAPAYAETLVMNLRGAYDSRVDPGEHGNMIIRWSDTYTEQVRESAITTYPDGEFKSKIDGVLKLALEKMEEMIKEWGTPIAV